jgi:hypothetical protein
MENPGSKDITSKKQQGIISMDAHMAIHNLRLGIDSHPETCDKQPA